MPDDDRLAGAAFLDQAYVDLGDAEVTGYAIDPLRGEIGLAVRGGRLPAGPHAVALGHRTSEHLGVGVGDTVRARTADGGDEATLTVVGEAVFPINDNALPGEGALLTPAGLDQVRGSDGFASLLLEYPPDADADRLEPELAEDSGLSFSAYSRPSLPGDVSNLDGARGVTLALGGFFAVLAVVGLAHALALSSRRRRFNSGRIRPELSGVARRLRPWHARGRHRGGQLVDARRHRAKRENHFDKGVFPDSRCSPGSGHSGKLGHRPDQGAAAGLRLAQVL